MFSPLDLDNVLFHYKLSLKIILISTLESISYRFVTSCTYLAVGFSRKQTLSFGCKMFRKVCPWWGKVQKRDIGKKKNNKKNFFLSMPLEPTSGMGRGKPGCNAGPTWSLINPRVSSGAEMCSVFGQMTSPLHP